MAISSCRGFAFRNWKVNSLYCQPNVIRSLLFYATDLQNAPGYTGVLLVVTVQIPSGICMKKPDPLILPPCFTISLDFKSNNIPGIRLVVIPKAAYLQIACYWRCMQVAVQPFPSLHMLQTNNTSTFNGITLLCRRVWSRLNNLTTVGIIYSRKSGDRLLPTARTIGHIMRMQPDLCLLMHQLDC
nr:hypothetical protein Iba_chr03fCG1530 [Ipomoea batatas]